MKKEEKKVNSKENEKFLTNFLKKYKDDKKYKAKTQLLGYGVVIIIIILYLIIARTTTPNNKNIVLERKNTINQAQNENDKKPKTEKLFETINNNYKYSINISYILKEENEEQEKKIHYEGKVSKENMEIIKEIDDTKNYYYKVNNKYYKKENDTFNTIKEEEIYDIVKKEFIELDSLKNYLNKASLDHVTDYSSGKKESVYHLKIKDIVPSYQDLDKIEINIEEENNILIIKIDYTKLIEITSNHIKQLKIEYTYTDIEATEEFKVFDEKTE